METLNELCLSIMSRNEVFKNGFDRGKSHSKNKVNPYEEASKKEREMWELGYKEGCKVFNERQWQKWVKGK